MSFGISDELGDRLGWNRWIHHHEVRHDNNAGDRRDVADEIEVELLIKRRVHRVRRMDEEERIAIRYRTHDGLRGDISAGARPVLDNELLAESLGQPLTHRTGDEVVSAARRDWHDQTHWPRRIGLRPRDAREGRQRGSAGGQM